jgi:DNA-binding transcriptional LysR family regulator
MAPIDLNDLRAFLDVHETGSFSLAAKRAGVPRSTVSRAVAGLERSLRVQLFYRSTRRVSTTAAGQALFERVSAPLAQLQGALEQLPERTEEPAGLLRVTSTVDVGMVLLSEAAARFTARYPRASVELHLDNQVTDLVGGGFDLALRILAKPMRDSTLIAKKLGTLAIGLYAAPAYLASRGTPRRTKDLAEHAIVAFGRVRSLALGKAPRVVCNDMLVAREILRNGTGIGALPSFLAAGDLASGTLVRVIPSWDLRTGIIYLVMPARTHVAPKVQAFRAQLDDVLRQRPLA